MTHFTVMTAGYLGGVLRKRCAVLEWNSHGDFRNMRKLCAKEQSQAGCFHILEADYYERAGIDTLLLCKKSGYQAVIVDYGTVRGNLEEFLRCDRQFVLGSLSEWQMETFLEFESKGKKKRKRAGRRSYRLEARKPEGMRKRGLTHPSIEFRFQ